MKANVNPGNPKNDRSLMSSSAWGQVIPLSAKGSKILAARKAYLGSRCARTGDVVERWLHCGFAVRLELGLGTRPTSHKLSALLLAPQVRRPRARHPVRRLDLAALAALTSADWPLPPVDWLCLASGFMVHKPCCHWAYRPHQNVYTTATSIAQRVANNTRKASS